MFKFALVVTISLLSLFAHAEVDPSIKLVKILDQHEVPKWGKRDRRNVEIYCSLRGKIQTECRISVPGPGIYAPNAYYKDLKNEEALELSLNLKEFGIEPLGKKAIQDVVVFCSKNRGDLTGPTNCRVFEAQI